MNPDFLFWFFTILVFLLVVYGGYRRRRLSKSQVPKPDEPIGYVESVEQTENGLEVRFVLYDRDGMERGNGVY